jgi:hypothetical protein
MVAACLLLLLAFMNGGVERPSVTAQLKIQYIQ